MCLCFAGMCLGVTELLNIFRTGSEKLGKANSLKIFFGSVSTLGEYKPVSLSLRGSFSSLIVATSCGRYFSDYETEII
jgi:hypothetical protein